jgi:hypothetical protein
MKYKNAVANPIVLDARLREIIAVATDARMGAV